MESLYFEISRFYTVREFVNFRNGPVQIRLKTNYLYSYSSRTLLIKMFGNFRFCFAFKLMRIMMMMVELKERFQRIIILYADLCV